MPRFRCLLADYWLRVLKILATVTADIALGHPA
jgi:hypothetical protein